MPEIPTFFDGLPRRKLGTATRSARLQADLEQLPLQVSAEQLNVSASSRHRRFVTFWYMLKYIEIISWPLIHCFLSFFDFLTALLKVAEWMSTPKPWTCWGQWNPQKKQPEKVTTGCFDFYHPIDPRWKNISLKGGAEESHSSLPGLSLAPWQPGWSSAAGSFLASYLWIYRVKMLKVYCKIRKFMF